jgi:hypothetical protein
MSADLTYQNTKSEINGSNQSKSTGLGDVVFNGRFRVLDSENRLDTLGRLAVRAYASKWNQFLATYGPA